MKPENFEERLVWYFLISTYVIYFVALLYPANSMLAWILFFYLCQQVRNQTKDNYLGKKIEIPWLCWVWTIGMLVIAIATFVACQDLDLGINATIRALLNWSRDWALLALFPLIGCLKIRPKLIYRAVCIVCLQSLILIPIFYLAYALNLPAQLYSSPVERLTQNGPMFYDVNLYVIDEETKQIRLFLFAPWGPAIGLVGNIYFFLALQEANKKWRWIGMAGAIAMSVVSGSRLAIISVPLVLVLVYVFTNLARPSTFIVAGILSYLSGLFSSVLITALTDFSDFFTSARAGSSQRRAILGRIAFERWQESPIWGHGIQEKGPLLVGRMPIGSHHAWLGVLFTKGLMGFFALLVPMLWSFVDLVFKAQKSVTARVALSFIITLFIFTFAENIELLDYLYWPALIVMGSAFKGEA